MKKASDLVRGIHPTALCGRLPKPRYQRHYEYIVYVDGDTELDLGTGRSAVSAWKDAWEMIQYMMVWQLEQ